MQFVHLYAKSYGWSKKEILNNVYLDEHFLMQEIIKDDLKQDMLMQFNLLMMPHATDEARKEFVSMLRVEKYSNEDSFRLGQKTDTDALQKLKAQMNN